ncbi:alkene reductase [Neorhizobium lilium]|uniref:Alkene reductase n=1 Tax=Neorhizobium lilium TaxID=2503024 RepID=A0A444LLX6_9HYPH|nr:alkene reductase [Neorhizobium lilium]RWX81313.1 alkene reductase [Neorhizobium lilium]
MKLLETLQLGRVELKNRIVMAPLGRARADAQRAPTELVATHYAQRSSAGLIISEACHISPSSATRTFSTANHTERQKHAWKKVVDSVHASGGVIFQQLTHVGRKALLSGLPKGERPVAPSAIAAFGGIMKENGLEEFPVPRELELHEIAPIVEDFRHSASLSRDAGFDGVEILAANGFLIDQFLRDVTNRRTDEYGGPVENRARFLLEAVDAVISEIGADRVGVRLSPYFRADKIDDSDPVGTFSYVVKELNRRGIAYIHILESRNYDETGDIPLHQRLVSKSTGGAGPRPGQPFLAPIMRKLFDGVLILNSGYDRETAEEAVATGYADAVSFGRLYISNPDLPERFRVGASLNEPDISTYYTNGPEGYIDYPFLDREAAVATHA